MASQWHSLISQKLFLAQTLLRAMRESSDRPKAEACWQGAAELVLRSRKHLLVMVARFYQDKQSEPDTLDALSVLIGNQATDVVEMSELARSQRGWWSHLDQLEQFLSRPVTKKKTVSADNIIAIAADEGPDKTPETLEATIGELKQFIDVLEDRHSEW